MHFSKAFLAAALPFMAAAVKTERTFAVNRIQGKGLTYGRMDPIVNPGEASGHTHMVVGGNKFNINMDDTVATTSTCASSLIKGDLSNYWIPHLYFQSPTNGSFYSVEMFYMNVYYFFEATDDDIVPFKPGFRMVSGDPSLRSPPKTCDNNLDPAKGDIQPVQITCPLNSQQTLRWPADSDGLHGIGIQDPNNKGSGCGFPNANCDGYASPMRMDIHFPSCYNPAAGLDDYKNNTAFPSSKGAKNGQNCPPGWEHTPHIFFEVYYNTPAFANFWTPGKDTQPFVFAMGDSTGYGLHGDFLSGWNEDTLKAIIGNCNAGDDGMHKCPDIPGGLFSTDDSSKCTIPAANPTEQVLGEMSALPGCNPVVGPGPAANMHPTCDGMPVHTTPYAPSLTPGASATGSVTGAPASASASASASAPGSAKPTTMIPSVTGRPSQASPSAAAVSTGAASGAPAPSGSSPAPAGWTSLGCFTDSKSPRALPGPTTNMLQSMTIDKCTDFCAKAGYEYAGLEYKSECYCGHDAPTQTSDQCSMPCVGDQSSMCGGWNAISVFKSAGSAKRGVHGHAAAHRRHARRGD